MKLEIFDNSKNYTCQVVRVKHLRKHSNADRLACTSVPNDNESMKTRVSENSLLIELEAEGLSPESFSLTEIGKIIPLFEQAVLPLAERDSVENVSIRLVSIEKGCVSILTTSELQDSVSKWFSEILEAVLSNEIANLPLKTANAVKSLFTELKKKKAKAFFRSSEKQLGVLSHEAEPDFAFRQEFTSRSSLYGKVIWIGGVPERITLSSDEGYEVECFIKPEQLEFFKKNLYSRVILNGLADWDADTYKITSVKVETAEEQILRPIDEAFDELREKFSHIFDKIENIDAYCRELRGD